MLTAAHMAVYHQWRQTAISRVWSAHDSTHAVLCSFATTPGQMIMGLHHLSDQLGLLSLTPRMRCTYNTPAMMPSVICCSSPPIARTFPHDLPSRERLCVRFISVSQSIHYKVNSNSRAAVFAQVCPDVTPNSVWHTASGYRVPFDPLKLSYPL